MSETSTYALNIDVFSANEVSGWVTDKTDPLHAPLTLQFVVDGIPSAIIRADVVRKDVEAAAQLEAQKMLGSSYLHLPQFFKWAGCSDTRR